MVLNNGQKVKYIIAGILLVILYLFRGVLFANKDSGTDSSSYNSEALANILYAPNNCDQHKENIKNFNVFSMDVDFLKAIKFKDEDQQCKCEDLGEGHGQYFNSGKDEKLKSVRAQLFKNYKKQNWNEYRLIEESFCNPKSPIIYPITAFNVEPREIVKITKVSILESISGLVTIRLSAEFGNVTVDIDGKKTSTIESLPPSKANKILSSMEYEALLYDGRPYNDRITFELSINTKVNTKEVNETEMTNDFNKSTALISVKVEKKYIPGLTLSISA